MKIGGIDPSTLPAEEVLVLPRGDNSIVFRAIGLKDMDEFNKLCPEPKAPGKLTKDGWIPNVQDKNYLTIMQEYGRRRVAYMVVKSLEPSKIEWETVDVANPATWANWEADLKAANFTSVEMNRVLQLVFEANCLDEAKLKRARENFLHGPPPELATSSGPSTEPVSSPSGEPVAE